MRRQSGFTIVELLVALALIIFIMTILTEAFSAGLETFRQLKAIGDMQERMRHVAIILRRDLRANHFANPSGGTATAYLGLSDVDLRPETTSQGKLPPSDGYFRIWQVYNANAPQYFQGSTAVGAPANNGYEGTDADNLPSTRSNQTWMAFTVNFPPLVPSSYLSASLPQPGNGGDANTNNAITQPGPAPDLQQGNTTFMLSRWAEVAYFLKPLTYGNTQVTAGSTPLYALYRRQRLLADQKPTTPVPLPWQNWSYYTEVSFPQPTAAQTAGGPPPTVTLNDSSSITIPTNRLGMDPDTTNNQAGVLTATQPPQPPSVALAQVQAAGGWYSVADLLGGSTVAQAGDDIILTNVISFDVKVLQEGYDPNQVDSNLTRRFVPMFMDLPPPSWSSNATFKNANTVCVFDTWSSQGAYANWAAPGTATSLPTPIRILALQITLRIWDDRTQQARQMTIIQDM